MPLLHRTFSFASAPAASPSESPTNSGPSESLISRVLLAPLLFVSFLVSLAIVDDRTSSSIIKSSENEGTSSKTKRTSGGNGKPSVEKGREGYYHSHQRKLMKREIGDAFAIRGNVLLALCLLTALGLTALGWGCKYLLEWYGWAWWKNGN